MTGYIRNAGFALVEKTSVCDSPEELSPDIAGQDWEVGPELAVQIRSNNSDRGA
jgi:hypothetical protein